MAIGNDNGTSTVNGNGAEQCVRQHHTERHDEPAAGLIQGSLNKPCLALPIKANVSTLTVRLR